MDCRTRVRAAVAAGAAAVVALSGTVVAATAFDDVPPSHPFHEDITWLAGTGITSGYPDGGYHPNDPVTRQAMAAFLRRLAGADPDVDPVVDAATLDGRTAADLDDAASVGGRTVGDYHDAKTVGGRTAADYDDAETVGGRTATELQSHVLYDAGATFTLPDAPTNQNLVGLTLPPGRYIVTGGVSAFSSEDETLLTCVLAPNGTPALQIIHRLDIDSQVSQDRVELTDTAVVTVATTTTYWLRCRRSTTGAGVTQADGYLTALEVAAA
jgi:hypothetical protein